ncbi:hypothetical protein ACOBQB_00540 [Streptomyces sp. G5(2025)]|uniref:hypothetical protein n=1 Tax=Streptomyces sp. G5(2025) TaxID=3406628 RepID=UPI003C203304
MVTACFVRRLGIRELRNLTRRGTHARIATLLAGRERHRTDLGATTGTTMEVGRPDTQIILVETGGALTQFASDRHARHVLHEQARYRELAAEYSDPCLKPSRQADLRE